MGFSRVSAIWSKLSGAFALKEVQMCSKCHIDFFAKLMVV